MSKLFAKLAVSDEFFEIAVRDSKGKVRKRLLPRIGWEQLTDNYWVLSKTRKWIRPLFMRRKIERGTVVYEAWQ